MHRLSDVIHIEYLGHRVFHVVFADGLEGDLDCSSYIGKGPIFEPLRDEAFVRMARVEGGTIAWPNGADISPEALYEKIRQSKDGPRFDP